ncbi:MAG: alpha-amylase [Bacteroidales bacterium]|nr:alpha-amylase [Bacteroidales bacterium]
MLVTLLTVLLALSCKPQPLPVIHTDDIVNAPSEALSLDATARANHSIYQVNLKLYGSSGAFGKVKARLDDIKAMGTEILYLMPVYPEGKQKAIGSPYCIRDFKGVNPSYGSLDELRSLVNDAHSKGMKVMFDWVANHTAWDNPWITDHPEWYEKNAKGEIVCPTKDGTWSDVAQLDYTNKQLWAAMEDALEYWVKTLDIDGYRCDYAHGVRDDFWKEAIARLKALKPGFIMLAESDFERMFDDGFDIIFDRAMKSNMRKLFGGGAVSDFLNWYKTDQGKAPAPKTKLYFVTNHDDATEGTPADQFGSNEAALAAYVLMNALNGSYMLYGSQEAGYAKTINFFNAMTMDWNASPALTAAYKNALSALAGVDRSGAMKAYSLSGLVLVTYGGKACVAVNTGKSSVTFGPPKSVTGIPEKVTLGSYEYKIF